MALNSTFYDYRAIGVEDVLHIHSYFIKTYKILFSFFKYICVTLLSFRGCFPQNMKCKILFNQS